jgi:cell wall-associated NlpC family hydrolase
MIEIPPEFLKVPYNSSHYPGVDGFNGLEAGANCQVFAYAFLAHSGIEVPPFRSSELWEDDLYTSAVAEFQPLDLLLFNHHAVAYGAHVTVYVGNDSILHLSSRHGHSVVEPISDLQRCHKYRCFIGAKRVHRT